MGSAEPLPESEWHAPLLADAEISAFDLLMPYLYWELLQSKLIGPDGAVTKTLTVRDLQKKSGQWMLKSIDLRNERTRDKTRFEVREAELGLELEPRLFKPEWLGEPVSLPESKRP